jgi:hypothetical protein
MNAFKSCMKEYSYVNTCTKEVLTSGNQENMPTEKELGAMLITDDLPSS